MEICKLEKDDEKKWDEFIIEEKDSTFYHQIGWKNIVQKTYGYKPHYLIAKENEEIKGVLPLFSMKSKIFGRKMVSIPFAPYGGISANSEFIKNALIDEANRLTKECDLGYLELRNLNEIIHNNYKINSLYITFIIRLEDGLDTIWLNLRRDKKKGVNKAKKANLSLEWNTDIDNFYDIYAITMKELGTPIHAYDFFKNIVNEFPDKTKILTVKYKDKAVCCKFLLFYKDTVISMWGSTLDEYQYLHPYDLANWEAIEYSYKKGYKYFDFGRCLLNSGVFQYKKGWPCEQKQLYYQFYIFNAKNLPDVVQSNPDRTRFARVWKKLPMPITKIVGPFLRKNFP